MIMNQKAIIHGITVAAIVMAAFVAAVLSPARTYAADMQTGVVNIAKVDHESRTLHADSRMITDNRIPLAESPYSADTSIPLGWLIVAGSALLTTFVIYEDLKDRMNSRQRS